MDAKAVLAEEDVTADAVEDALHRDERVAGLLSPFCGEFSKQRTEPRHAYSARALANGVKGDAATLDIETRFARTATSIDVPELRLLTVLLGPWHARTVDGEERQADAAWRDELVEAWPDAAGVLDAMLARLVGVGLAEGLTGVCRRSSGMENHPACQRLHPQAGG
jgi:hypothetical protein